MTMTHSAVSSSSCGMLSGTSSTSCITTPQFSRRTCSLLLSAMRNVEPNTKQSVRLRYRRMSDLVFERRTESCVRACLPNEWIAALNDAHQDRDDRHDQQNVDQASHRVRRDHPKEPQRQCDGQNC